VSGRTALWICGIALALGLIGDYLLRPEPGGVGTALWLVLCCATALAVARSVQQSGLTTLTACLGTAALFAAFLAWRDAEALKGWDLLACATALFLALLELRSVRLRVAGVLEYATETIRAGFRLAVGPFALLGSDLGGTGPMEPGTSRRLRGIAIGTVVTIPIVLVFGALLASADPVFERLARFLVAWDLDQLVSHLVVIGLLTWLAAAGLRSVVVRQTPGDRPLVDLRPPAWGALEIGIPLGAMAVLFLTFIVIQARYLFGGDDLIRTTVDLTYAEYARRGFFELVTVAGLVLPVLMAADWARDAADGTASRLYRGLASALLVLVGLIIASAAVRLRMYGAAYGLTEDRFYAAAIMVWVALALLWFGVTALRSQRDRFVFGAIVAGFVVVAAMNVANPDAMIARVNLARAAQGAELDASYLRWLGDDATPALVAGLPALSATDRCAIAGHLAERAGQREGDWRTWNLGRAGADAAYERFAAMTLDCPDPETAGT